MTDLADELPPRLYEYGGTPPVEAWDVQVAAPPALVAWLEQREAEGRPSILYDIPGRRVFTTLAAALPGVPMQFDRHDRVGVPRADHPHVHVLIGMRDKDGRLVERDDVEKAAAEAWIAHIDRLVEYTRQRTPLGITWTRDGGIASVDHSHVPEFAPCVGFYGGNQSVIVAGP